MWPVEALYFGLSECLAPINYSRSDGEIPVGRGGRNAAQATSTCRAYVKPGAEMGANTLVKQAQQSDLHSSQVADWKARCRYGHGA